MNSAYAKAYTEVLEVISYFSEDNYLKIPTEIVEYLKKNKDNDYKFSINPNIDLDKQNISKKANAIIVDLYEKYFATDTQKQTINDILKLNRKKVENIKKNNYYPNSIFGVKNEKLVDNIEENKKLPVKVNNENKFLRFIKNLFGKK